MWMLLLVLAVAAVGVFVSSGLGAIVMLIGLVGLVTQSISASRKRRVYRRANGKVHPAGANAAA